MSVEVLHHQNLQILRTSLFQLSLDSTENVLYLELNIYYLVLSIVNPHSYLDWWTQLLINITIVLRCT